jgi:hypothetical protein
MADLGKADENAATVSTALQPECERYSLSIDTQGTDAKSG